MLLNTELRITAEKQIKKARGNFIGFSFWALPARW